MRLASLVLIALAIVSLRFEASEAARSVARRVPFVLIVPYFTIMGGVRASSSVSVYRTDAVTGEPTRVAGSPFAAGRNPGYSALAAGGRFAYVLGKDANVISAYQINATTAALRPVPGSPFTVDYSASGPASIAVAPSGKHVYVTSDAGVSAFSIDAATGALRVVPGSPFRSGTSDGFGTISIALEPSNAFAYVLNRSSNTIATYAIDANGALRATPRSLPAGQNSNDPGAFGMAAVDPKGAFLYVTSACCVSVYPNASTGALGRPAHQNLGMVADGNVSGFAIAPSGKFAYVADDAGRAYAYAIDATTGALKALPGRAFSVRSGSGSRTDSYHVTIDRAGTFAYVVDSGNAVVAPAIAVYRIDGVTGELTPALRSPYTVATTTADPVARWFDSGRCAAFEDASAVDNAPLAERDAQGVLLDRVTAATRGYFYDPKTGVALHYPATDSDGTFTLRRSGSPPPGVPHHDLSALHTASGLRLGSTAADVVRRLGKPKIVRACGLERYVYLKNRDGEPTSLEFTIGHDRVIEIFEDFGG